MRLSQTLAIVIGLMGCAETKPAVEIAPAPAASSVASSASSAAPAPATSASPSPTTTECPPDVSIDELLARHARIYGSPDQIASELPLTFASDPPGAFSLTLAADAHRTTWSRISGAAQTRGLTSSGAAWVLTPDDIPTRLVGPEESVDVALESWVFRRRYLDEKSFRTTCGVSGNGGTTVAATAIGRRDLGSPTLTFDLTSAELLVVARRHPALVWGFGGAGPPDPAGVRWSKVLITDESIMTEMGAPQHGLLCAGHLDGEGSREHCLDMPKPKLKVVSLPTGKTRVPARFDDGRVQISVDVEGRPMWALIDTGSPWFLVDPASPFGHVVHARPVEEIESVAFGGLRLAHIPFQPTTEGLLGPAGRATFELVVGGSVLRLVAIRIDYARREVFLSPDAESLLVASERTSLPMTLRGGEVTVPLTIEGRVAPFAIDTGGGGSELLLDNAWSKKQGWWEDRPHQRGRQAVTVAGMEEVTSFEIATAALGPLVERPVAAQAIDLDWRKQGIAGVIGNPMLSGCPAVVIDIPKRHLWLEGPCGARRIAPTRATK